MKIKHKILILSLFLSSCSPKVTDVISMHNFAIKKYQKEIDHIEERFEKENNLDDKTIAKAKKIYDKLCEQKLLFIEKKISLFNKKISGKNNFQDFQINIDTLFLEERSSLIDILEKSDKYRERAHYNLNYILKMISYLKNKKAPSQEGAFIFN